MTHYTKLFSTRLYIKYWSVATMSTALFFEYSHVWIEYLASLWWLWWYRWGWLTSLTFVPGCWGHRLRSLSSLFSDFLPKHLLSVCHVSARLRTKQNFGYVTVTCNQRPDRHWYCGMCGNWFRSSGYQYTPKPGLKWKYFAVWPTAMTINSLQMESLSKLKHISNPEKHVLVGTKCWLVSVKSLFLSLISQLSQWWCGRRRCSNSLWRVLFPCPGSADCWFEPRMPVGFSKLVNIYRMTFELSSHINMKLKYCCS